MKISSALAAVIAFAGLSSVAEPEKVYWDVNGTGGWGDATRWTPREVPGASTQVRVQNGVTAIVTDADLTIFTKVPQIVLEGATSVLAVSNGVDCTVAFEVVGSGKVIKGAAGKLSVQHGGYNRRLSNSGGVEVNDGSLAFLGNEKTALGIAGPTTINAPGKFIAPTTGNIVFHQLFGDGTLVYASDYAYHTYSASTAGDPPGSFSGTVEGNLSFWGGEGTPGSNQDFTNPDYAVPGSFYGKGRLGFVAFPTVVPRVNCTFEYVGDGGESDTGYVYLNNDTYVWTMSGGPVGGYDLRKTITANAQNGERMMMVEWAGNHVNPCTFSGNLTIGNYDKIAIYYKKTGTGTWRFTNGTTRRNKGVVATEQGTLEYETIAEKGTTCSLGTASMLQSEYYGVVPDPTKDVPYAYLIGDGTNHLESSLATMRYVGTTDARVEKRPVAIKGAGAFEAQGAPLNWTGFTCAQTGANTLVLGGAAAGSVANSVTNGLGTLSLVKRGRGSWTLDGDYDLSGSVQVDEGSLTFQSAAFKYYKLTLMQNWRDTVSAGDGSCIWLSQFGLFDADGNNWVEELKYNSAAVNNAPALQPGQVSFGTAGITYLSGNEQSWSITNVFNSAETSGAFVRYGKPVVENKDTWVSLLICPNAGHNPIVKYDLRNRTFGNNKNYEQQWARDVRSWKLEGSIDGKSWTELHSVISNSNPVTEGMYRWACDHGTTPTGWTIASSAPLTRPSALSCVGAKEGASLISHNPILVKGLKIDAAAGSGVISGFDLAETGTLTVENADTSAAELTLPFNFVGIGNSSRLMDWTVLINGQPSRRKMSISPTGITLRRDPLVIIFN